MINSENDNTSISYWQISTYLLAIILFGLSLRWAYLDQSPPRWDESGYLLQATVMHNSLVDHGPLAFFQQVFNYDRGRVLLIPLIVQPLFLIFGPSLDVAMVSLNLFWFLLAWAIFGLTRDIVGPKLGDRAGFFAFAFFSLYPRTTELSNYFLVEFPLVSIIAATHYALLRYYRTHKNKWLWLTGLFLGLGMLTKVTFPVFVLSCFVLFFIELLNTRDLIKTLKIFYPVYLTPLIIAGSYYSYNIKQIIASTALLSSTKLAKSFNFGAVYDWNTIYNYWKAIYFNPSMGIAVICLILVCIASLSSIRNKELIPKIDNFSQIMLLTWFFVPFILATLGTIKDIRYVYPALLPMFIVFGLAISILLEYYVYIPIVVGIYLVPLSQYLVSNNFVKLSAVPYQELIFAQSPDPQDWKNKEIVTKIGETLEAQGLKKEVIFLGGNRYYNVNQFRYYGLITDQKITFTILPYFTTKSIETTTEAMEFVKNTSHSAILYKTGSNYPKFVCQFDQDIIGFYKHDSNYENIDLNIEQPDGSKFYLLIKKRNLSPLASLKEADILKMLDYKYLILKDVIFGDKLKLIGATLRNSKKGIVIAVYWKSLTKQRNNYLNFIHLLDATGKIIEQLDHPINKDNGITLKDDVFVDIITIPKNQLRDIQKIGFGLYLPSTNNALVDIDKTHYQTDWSGKRLLINVGPTLRKHSNSSTSF